MTLIDAIKRTLNVRFIRFAIVGGLGVVVNQTIFTLVFALTPSWSDSVRANVAASFGFAISCFTNFLMNDNWTWRDRRNDHSGFLKRLITYYVVALGALAVQLLTLNLVISAGWMNPWWANLMGIAAGTLSNFVLNHFWTFRIRRT